MASFGDAFRLTLLTGNSRLAADADRFGVDRIGIDLERLGKAERQAGHDTRLSEHRLEDLERIGGVLTTAKLFVRIDPPNPNTGSDIERVIAAGAAVIMLPQFRHAREVETFVRLVDGRALPMLLVETPAAVVRLRDILAVAGVGEVMVGLNDLHLAFGVANHFEVLASPLLDGIAAEVHRAGLPLSLGGVGRIGDRSLPISPDLVMAQYPRLGATGAWLSRSFMAGLPTDWDFQAAIGAVRERMTQWAAESDDALERARDDLAAEARGTSLSREGHKQTI